MVLTTPLSRVVRLATLVCTLFALPLSAQWRLEAWLGDAYNFRTPVTFSQEGQADFTMTPHWSTRPFEPTWYYSGRIAKWSGSSGWGFHYMHHKVYLDNPQGPVQSFRITNGINNLLVERMWRRSGFEWGVGLGPAFLVPKSRVRTLLYDHANGVISSRYELGGATLEGEVARRLRLLPFTYGTLAIKGTASYLRANIADGKAKLWDFALHIQYGLSLQTKSR